MKNSKFVKIFAIVFVITTALGAVSFYSAKNLATDLNPTLNQYPISILRYLPGLTFNDQKGSFKLDLVETTPDHKFKRILVASNSADIDIHVRKKADDYRGGVTCFYKSQAEMDSAKSVGTALVTFSEDTLFLDLSQDNAQSEIAKKCSQNLFLEIPKSFEGILEIKSVSGNITVHESHAQQIKVKNISGDTILNALKNSPKINLSSVSGDIETHGKVGNAEIQSISGDVLLQLPPMSRAHFDLNTVSGDISNSFQNRPIDTPKPAASNTNNKTLMKVSTTSGNVYIEEE